MKRHPGETDSEFIARFAQAAAERADDDATDEWQLNRDPDESDTEYAARCAMLGCDPNGMIRLRRSKRSD